MNKAMLALALGATILAVVYAPQDANEDVVAPVVRNTANSSGSASSSPTTVNANAQSDSKLSNKSAYPLQIVARHFDDGGEQAKSSSSNAAGSNMASVWGSNLFANTNWAPPPPPEPAKPIKPPPPPPPSAPPLPFQYLGRWVEDGKVHFFLQMQDRNLSVQVGEEIGQYKFESAQGGQLRFIYLPLQQAQTLAVGEIN